MNHLTKNQWVQLFEEIGITDKQMSKWHTLFEQKFPDAHLGFLKWLGLTENEILTIRKKIQ